MADMLAAFGFVLAVILIAAVLAACGILTISLRRPRPPRRQAGGGDG